MARRNAIRRAKILDEGQTQEALKVLEKFCRNKYPNAVFVSQADLADDDVIQRPTSMFFGSRQSTTFSVIPDGRGAASPGMVSDFSEHTIKEEIKYDSRKENLWKYCSRVTSFFYSYFALKYLLLVFLLIIYALIGGYIFMSFEMPEQQITKQMLSQATVARQTKFSTLILQELLDSECLDKLLNSSRAALQLDNSNSLCQHEIRHILKMYDDHYAIDYGITEGWMWDYWNAVFYAGTVFTTIGYGNLTCKTTMGRLATILYALIGIPMTLFILNMLGTALFGHLGTQYSKLKRAVRNLFKAIRRKLKGRPAMTRTSTIQSVALDDILDLEKHADENEEEENNDDSEKVPLYVILVGGLVFTFSCSVLFSIWEEWDWFTSFYFTFISLSTIGFGDVIPEHPKYACVLFIFYFIGLWLISVVIAVIQARVEDKYMWALQLIDQDRQAADEYVVNPPMGQSTDNLDETIRWRKSSTIQRESMASPQSILMNPGDDPVPVPPVLGVFLQRQMTLKRNSSLARSESVLSRGSIMSRFRPFTPSVSEQLTPLDSRMRMAFPGVDHPTSGMHSSVRTPGSLSSLATQRNLTATVPLSVISENSDEETLHSRKSSKPRRDLRDFFTKISRRSTQSDTDGEVSALCTPTAEEQLPKLSEENPVVEEAQVEDIIILEADEENESEEPLPPLTRPTTLNFRK